MVKDEKKTKQPKKQKNPQNLSNLKQNKSLFSTSSPQNRNTLVFPVNLNTWQNTHDSGRLLFEDMSGFRDMVTHKEAALSLQNRSVWTWWPWSFCRSLSPFIYVCFPQSLALALFAGRIFLSKCFLVLLWHLCLTKCKHPIKMLAFFSGVATTKYHLFGWFKHTYFLRVLGLQVQDQGVSWLGFPPGLAPESSCGLSLCLHTSQVSPFSCKNTVLLD